MWKKIFIGLAVVLVAIQFVRPAKNADWHRSDDDIFESHPASDEIRDLIHESCYDCHSNQTRYPWYAEIQPVSWWLASHVSDGKAELNFSEFARYSTQRAARKLDKCDEELDDDAMPLPSYRWMHPKARLTAEQKRALEAWFDATHDKISPSTKSAKSGD